MRQKLDCNCLPVVVSLNKSQYRVSQQENLENIHDQRYRMFSKICVQLCAER